jgi:hypothetical protein
MVMVSEQMTDLATIPLNPLWALIYFLPFRDRLTRLGA